MIIGSTRKIYSIQYVMKAIEGDLSYFGDDISDESDDSCGRKEGNALFNDALNTFYLRLYGVRHMVKYHTDSDRRNPLPPHGLLFPISSKGYFTCTTPKTGLHIPQPFLHQSWSTGWNEMTVVMTLPNDGSENYQSGDCFGDSDYEPLA